MTTYTLQLQVNQKESFMNYYQNYLTAANNKYLLAKYKYHQITILLYQSLKVVFQGADETTIKQQWAKWNPKPNLATQINIIGSDESGVGDFFGPLVVTACYLEAKDLPLIKSLTIRDSKTLSTVQINMLAKQLMAGITYKTIIINNLQYNKLYQTYKNSHIIKAIGHHQVITKLAASVKCNRVIIDQFVNKTKYQEYLKILKAAKHDLKLEFATHAEDKFLAVACAAIISRYFFLKTIKELESKYYRTLPLGAGPNVDRTITNIISENATQDVINFGKLHFINWKKHFPNY